MCPNYVVEDDQFGVGLSEYCELIEELLRQFGVYRFTPSDDSERDSYEDIPY